MDSNEYDELSKDPNRLLEYLGDHIDDISRTLGDDEDFCNKDIDATIKYVENIEKKFNEKIQELKNKLEQIRLDNKKISEQNKKQFEEEIKQINELFSNEKYYEAWKKFQDYEKIFQQRSTFIQHIPKLHMNEMDIEKYFSSDHKPDKPSPIQSTIVIPPTAIKIDDDKKDPMNDIPMTNKERLRKEKVIETIHIDKNNEELNNEKTEQNVDNPQFGIRSKHQQTTINETITNPPAMSVPPRPTYRFSTRLGPSSNSNNRPFSGRSVPSIPQRLIKDLNLNPGIEISHYQHEGNTFLLMACNSQYIVLFTSPRNRLDRWHLGVIERRIHSENSLDWHDGLIISMGYIGNNNIYMFTEREFFVYSISQRRKLDSRILPRGNDDGFEIPNSSNEYQRGIGTVFNKHMYHIYLNRSSHWTLSKNSLEKLVRMYDYDLTRLFPDVLRFIHLCVNEKTINFLVQMNDLSYAVVFCSTNDCLINDSMSPIILVGAKQPLTIYSAYINSLKREIFFINDPLIDILHIITIEKYLQSYSVIANAICYVADKHELMIVRNNSICSINLNELN